jgi:hypothetical protein
MKRPYLFAVALVALMATACQRKDCVSTTNTTSATVVPNERPNASPGNAASAAATDATNPPNSDATTSAARGSSATPATTSGASSTAAAPIDITGPSPAVTTNGSSTGAGTAAGTDTNGQPPAPPPPFGNSNATSTTTTTGAPLVSPGLDNQVTGGVANTGAPLDYATPIYVTPMGTIPRPVGGPMRPGAAGNPDTTSGAR